VTDRQSKGAARALGLLADWLAGRPPTRSGAREIEQAHQGAVAAYRAETRRYALRSRALQAQATGGTAVAGVAGTVGVFDIIAETVTGTGAVTGPAWVWITVTAGSTVVALRARAVRRRLRPPAAPAIPPPPPSPLPRDAVGAAEAARLTSLRVQLLQVAPTIDGLEPAAGAELRHADAQAAPALNALVDRLVVLDRIMRARTGVPGQDSAADAAYESALELRDRLASGCAAYDALLAACARLMAAPEVGTSTDDILGPALDAMVAYAHGLRRSASVDDDL
jgi:hypothetical protein